MDRRDVANWIAHYEHAWRSPGTHELEALFTPGALYSQGPYRDPVEGLDAIAQMWEGERTGPDEHFSMTSALVALDEEVAVARVEVHYHDSGKTWRDLWVMRFDAKGLCTAFEEWPIAPEQE
ncbi:MAG TPA: nuclear transport factor 2 family protein [Thermoleophilaceae bacterium]|nr:nuclear transport factor 2 family protein [Thermoleophilaceae bacterium]